MGSERSDVNKPPSKSDLRQRLQRQTAAFLSGGGKIQELAVGESAYERHEVPPPAPLFQHTSSSRTPLTDVIAALEKRRAERRPRHKIVRRRSPKRRKQVVYDDFGEPLRVVWIEE